MMRHSLELERFVAKHIDRLRSASLSAFFSVSLSAAGDMEEQQRAKQYVQDFLKNVGWNPTLTATFAGALPYSNMNPGFRIMIRSMVKARESLKGSGGLGDMHPWKDEEYTDWDAVDEFAFTVAEHLRSRREVATS